jgi:hypothetical protein
MIYTDPHLSEQDLRVVADFVDSYRSLLDPQVPSGNGSAALLKAKVDDRHQ